MTEAGGSQSSGEPPASPGILASNVGSLETHEPPRRRGSFPYPVVLGGLLLFVLGAGAALFWTGTQQRTPVTTRPTVAPTPATGSRSSGAAAGQFPDINGISCDALESTIVHIHLHLAVFINGEEQQIPFGIGIGQPWQVADSNQGPFVQNGTCFYWIHTHTEDGVVHIESPVRRRFTLGDFFAIWQVPLSATQVGSAQGEVVTYVNGQRSSTNPSDIPLLPHARIQLDVGGDVPPYQFDFPPGE
jgi:hypothetical protein